MHAAISGLLDGVNAIAVAQATAEPAGRDWREGDSGQELRAAAMHATMRCSHDARHRGEFYEAAAAATRVIAARLRELYGSLAGRRIGG
jgi:hypothetical protein